MKALVQFFRAVSDEPRLRIVMLLIGGELCVCDLMVILNEPQSKLSRHLAYLKHSGIVSSKRAGVWMHYSLKTPLNEVYRLQLDLFKEKLSSLSPFKQDLRKMLRFKAKGGCESLAKARLRSSTQKNSMKRRK